MKDIVDFIKGFDLHTIVTIGIAFWWLNGSIHDVEDRLDAIEKDMIAVKTALSIHKILPAVVASSDTQKRSYTFLTDSEDKTLGK